jgi:hypothetical protein
LKSSRAEAVVAFVFRLGLVKAGDVSRLKELVARRATLPQIDAFLAEHVQDWDTWKPWLARFKLLRDTILKDPDASEALEILTRGGADEVDLLWGVARYVAVRQYMASPEAKRSRQHAEAYGERVLKRMRDFPRELRKVARRLVDDPRFLVLQEQKQRLLMETHNNLNELAQAFENLPKEYQPHLKDVVRLSRRGDYTGIVDGIRRLVKEATRSPYDREVAALLHAACKAERIRTPEADSIRRHSYHKQPK